MSKPAEDKYDAERIFREMYGIDTPREQALASKEDKRRTPQTSEKKTRSSKRSEKPAQKTRREAPASAQTQPQPPLQMQPQPKLLHRAYYITEEQDMALGLKHLKCRDLDRSTQVRAALELFLEKELKEIRAGRVSFES